MISIDYDTAEINKQKYNVSRRKDWNIFILGLGFFLVYTGYLTTASVSETILRSYSDRTGNSVNGLISLVFRASVQTGGLVFYNEILHYFTIFFNKEIALFYNIFNKEIALFYNIFNKEIALFYNIF